MVDVESADTNPGAGASIGVDALDRWLRLRVPSDGEDRGPLSPADISADLARAGVDMNVAGIELTLDSIDSVEEVASFLDAFDDRDVRIGTLVVEIR